MLLRELIQEKKEDKKKKIVFVETDGKEAFPSDTVAALQKQINKGAKDLTVDWKSAVDLVDNAFEELSVPKPLAYLKDRWTQYQDLLSGAVKSLKDARGMKANWVKTV